MVSPVVLTTGTDRQLIPFNRPTASGREADYIAQALSAGHLSGDGAFTRHCSKLLEQETGAAKALLTTSCTHALEMAALLLDLRPGDEVIVPSFTFVSTLNAFVLRGARPRCVDIRADTLNIDETLIEREINERTRAIFLVHYAGVGCGMDVIMKIARARGLAVVEDNAHGLFGSYQGRPLGSFGDFATLSFHETKNITCGEGGAILINNPAYVDRAEIIREKGTDRSRFFRGQVDKYTWVDVGSSYLPSELNAAFLWGQLEVRHEIQRRRSAIWQEYGSRLQEWAEPRGVRLPYVPPDCEHPAHMFYLLMPSLEARQAFIAQLRKANVMATFHYLPLHLSPMGLRYGYAPGDLPIVERVSDQLVRLPLFSGMQPRDVDRVIEAVCAWAP
ncbi:MAG TPA: dTDP-4-amino-4,6-dideoxygalactose transaminase [Longimicrobiales bacterium]